MRTKDRRGPNAKTNVEEKIKELPRMNCRASSLFIVNYTLLLSDRYCIELHHNLSKELSIRS